MVNTVLLGLLLALLCTAAPQQEDSKALQARKLAQELATATLAGKSRKFVDGAGLQRKANRERLPSLPNGFELPPIPQPELLPDK